MRPIPPLSRRRFLQGSALVSLAAACRYAPASGASRAGAVSPLPLSAVRLGPSIYLRAVDANRAYLHRLEPDRLLHNYRQQAGLRPRGELYGGWERETIAGHSLGHYLSACALMHAQTGDAECLARANYIVAELAACQRAHRDGYLGGFTRTNTAGQVEPGRRALEEIARGDIRPERFHLNGSWAPFYNWHKLLAGLLEAHQHCGSEQALAIAVSLAAYIERTLASLDQSQMQALLGTEFGGIGEALAELHVRSGDARWLSLARRFHHHAVLDPLMAGRDELAHLHANTQIPKIAALARLHEIEGLAAQLAAAEFFWRTVTGGHSYVIGGNSDREHFQEPGSVSRYITEQTCESCNTYNMLKLTRRLYGLRPDGAYFDYYERAHLNHIMAQQRPADGAFAYMVPLMSGCAREFSEPFDSFWCCVGTGMESHSKHGDSVYWQDRATLYVNLFVPSSLDWQDRNARVVLDMGYPFDDRVALHLESIEPEQEFSIALRRPAWCDGAALRVNGEAHPADPDSRGYLAVRRRWRSGDRIELDLPRRLRFESTPDDEDTVALLHGPLVLAADLGPAGTPFEGVDPVLVGGDPLADFVATDARRGRFHGRDATRPPGLGFAPFFDQYDRRTAVYFRRFTPERWAEELALVAAARERAAAIDARSVDMIRLGDEADERRHRLESALSYPVVYRRRPGRDARSGGFFAFDATVSGGPLLLQATYWGGERERLFHVEVDGERIATQRLHGEQPGEFIDRDYPLPASLVEGKERLRVRFVPVQGSRAGPVFGCRILRHAA